jgi:hypothetical protein
MTKHRLWVLFLSGCLASCSFRDPVESNFVLIGSLVCVVRSTIVPLPQAGQVERFGYSEAAICPELLAASTERDRWFPLPRRHRQISIVDMSGEFDLAENRVDRVVVNDSARLVS